MKHLLLTILLLAPFGCYAQLQGKAKLDSVLAALPAMARDTTTVLVMAEISRTLSDIDPKQGLLIAKQAVALGDSLGHSLGKAQAYRSAASNDLALGDQAGALASYFEAIKWYEAAGKRDHAAGNLVNVAIVFGYQKEYDKAIRYCEQALAIGLELNYPRVLQFAYQQIGIVYSAQNLEVKAIEYFNQAMVIAQERKDSVSIVSLMSGLSGSYEDLGDHQASLDHALPALLIAQRLGLSDQIGSIYTNLGCIYTRMADDSILANTKERRLHYAHLAVEYMAQAVQEALANGERTALVDTYEWLSSAYALNDEPVLALKFYKQFAALRDSIYTKENTALISGLETKRMVELKEKDIEIARLEVLKKRNERWFFIAGIILLLGIMGSLFRSFRKQRQANVVITLEKKRSDDLLLNILPAEVAVELMDTGAAAAKHFEQATILFTDFKGFTQASETMTPQDLVAELNTCFAAFDHIITARGIEKIKTIGDAYMCVGGLPDPKSSSPTAVVHAALEMQAFMIARKNERDAQGLPAFEMRVGIHTGPVVAGIVGVKKFQYDIWGDTVNTASRMESSGAVGEVNISEATYALVKDAIIGEDGVASTLPAQGRDDRVDGNNDGDGMTATEHVFTFTPRGKVQAKGKGEMEMYFVQTKNRL